MVRQPPQYTLADTLFPSTTLVRSGVARIVIARARPAQRRADFESEAEGIARRGIGAVARTARQPVAETGAAFGAVFGDDPAIIAAHRQPAERQRRRRLDPVRLAARDVEIIAEARRRWVARHEAHRVGRRRRAAVIDDLVRRRALEPGRAYYEFAVEHMLQIGRTSCREK